MNGGTERLSREDASGGEWVSESKSTLQGYNKQIIYINHWPTTSLTSHIQFKAKRLRPEAERIELQKQQNEQILINLN